LWARLLLAAVIVTGAPFTRREARRCRSDRPDLVLLAVDFVIQGVRGGQFVAPEVTSAKLAEVAAPFGVFAVLGNHDWWLRQFIVRSPRNRALRRRRGLVC
jgi:predicted MPP superfamily phosphohydrolase